MNQALLKKWNLGEIKSIIKVEKGDVNHNWTIQSEKGKFILRKVAKHKTLEGLKYELKYLKKLKEKKFPYEVPLPILNRNKGETVKEGKNHFWMYKYIEGEIIEKVNRHGIKELAKMMTYYHNILEKIELKNGIGNLSSFAKLEVFKELKEFREKIIKKKKKNNEETIFLQESKKLIPILESLDTSYYDKLSRYPIHRDLNPENIVWKNNKIIGILDFDNVDQVNDALIKDVSIVLQYCCPDKLKIFDIGLAKIFIKEYRKYRELSKEEVKLIPEILSAAYIEDFSYQFWLIENDLERAKKERLNKYSELAQWFWKNKERIRKELS